MKSVHDILILQKTNERAELLRDLFQSKGFSVVSISDVKALVKSLKQLSLPILLVDCGRSDDNFEFIKEIVKVEETREYPTMILGPDASSFDNVLRRYYAISASVSTPCDNLQILEAISYLAAEYERKAREREITRIKSPGIKTEAEGKRPDIPTHQLYTAFKNIPSLIFSQAAQLNLANNSFRANEYVKALKGQTFKLRDYLPQDTKVAETITSFTAKVDKWSSAHIHRTAFMSFKILENLNLSEDVRNAAKTAAFMMSWSFAETSPSLLKRDYLAPKAAGVREQLSAKIKESADRIAAELGMPQAAEIVASCGAQIGYQETVSDSPISLAASAIAASDLVDRLCWALDFWNPRAVNRLMKKIKAGEVSDFHPSVLSCVVTFLAQSRSTKELTLLVPKHIRNNKELIEFAQSIKDQKIDHDERKVPISALAPGMRLSRPVFAFDGEQVLCEDLILDEDLIWRLWQLSAVRPLNTPLVIREKN